MTNTKKSAPKRSMDRTQQPAVREGLQVRSEISGPLPSPEILAGYESILPGAAERILRMAEKSQDNRHEISMVALTETAADTRRGQRFALCSVLASFSTGAFL